MGQSEMLFYNYRLRWSCSVQTSPVFLSITSSSLITALLIVFSSVVYYFTNWYHANHLESKVRNHQDRPPSSKRHSQLTMRTVLNVIGRVRETEEGGENQKWSLAQFRKFEKKIPLHSMTKHFRTIDTLDIANISTYMSGFHSWLKSNKCCLKKKFFIYFKCSEDWALWYIIFKVVLLHYKGVCDPAVHWSRLNQC